MKQRAERTFLHSGKLGDLIYSLPTIRALGGGTLYLRTNENLGFDQSSIRSVVPLLRQIPYIRKVQMWKGEKVDFELDAFRSAAGTFDNIAHAHFVSFGLDLTEADTPWLEAAKPPKGYLAVFARSLIRTGVDGFWQEAFRVFGHEAVFVGTAEEHSAFQESFGKLPRCKTANLAKLASVISASDLFIGNQSCPYAIAEGLKRPAILEVDSTCPNCIFRRPDLLHVRSAADLWQIEHARELLRLPDPGRSSWSMPAKSPLDEPIKIASQAAQDLQMLRLKIAARQPVEVLVDNAGHWSEVLRTVCGVNFAPSSTDGNMRIRAMSPDDVIAVLLESDYRILSTIATSELCPAITGPLSRAVSESSEEAFAIEQRLQLRQVEIVAEPVSPVRDNRTAGLLRTASVEGCSVVILTFNSMETIESCLKSVLTSLRSKDELIVVDNASSDATASNVKKLLGSDGRLIVNTSNLGFSAGINVGLKESKGRLIGVLNPDTVVPQDWLDRLDKRFKDPLLAAVGPVSNYVSGLQFVGHHLPKDCLPGLTDDEVRKTLDETQLNRNLITKLLIGFCIMIRRSAVNKVGLFDEDLFLGSDDLEMSWRLRTHGYRLAIARDVYVRHEGGASFASLDSDESTALLRQSSESLAAKIRGAYAPGPTPTSLQLFDNRIFEHMLG